MLWPAPSLRKHLDSLDSCSFLPAAGIVTLKFNKTINKINTLQMNDQLNLLNSLHCTQVYSVRWSRLYSFCTVYTGAEANPAQLDTDQSWHTSLGQPQLLILSVPFSLNAVCWHSSSALQSELCKKKRQMQPWKQPTGIYSLASLETTQGLLVGILFTTLLVVKSYNTICFART